MTSFDYSIVKQNSLQFLESPHGPPLNTLTPDEARAVLSGLQFIQVEKLPAVIDDHAIPNGGNDKLIIKILDLWVVKINIFLLECIFPEVNES